MSVIAPSSRRAHGFYWDKYFLLPGLFLLLWGVVMVGSASVSIAEQQTGNPLYYFWKQLAFALMGIAVAFIAIQVRVGDWRRFGMSMLWLALLLLVLVLLPGLGKTVNGSTRWIPLGPINVQVSAIAQLLLVVYLAGYLERRNEQVRQQVSGFLKPMALLCIAGALLLLQPDFGALAILLLTAMAMLFLGGVRLWQFVVLLGLFSLTMISLVYTSPNRMRRVTGFLDPWSDPLDSGFQLVQSLIAIGSGSVSGVGLGSSVQKLFYLPEAHTDFLFAVLAEEFGLLGVLTVLLIYSCIVVRGLSISAQAASVNHIFAAYLAAGLSIWFGGQAAVNIGVNMGLLPTKGLTLPLMSSGGSSTIVMCLLMALLLRISHETRIAQTQARGRRRRSRSVAA